MQQPSEALSHEPLPSEPQRYECKWRDEAGRSVHYWVDHNPTEPIWPPANVMRWDLRPDDWHLIWAELLDHPCALLFAPKHPHRPGPPRFRDWVQSWPAGFDWVTELPEHLHEAVRRAQAELSTIATEPATALPDAMTHTQERPSVAATVSGLVDDTVARLAVLLRDLDDSKRGEAEKLLSTLVLAPDSAKVVHSLARLLMGTPDPQVGAKQ